MATMQPVTIVGEFRDNGVFHLNFSLDINLGASYFGTSAPDPQFGVYSTEATAQRVINSLTKIQTRTGEHDWTNLHIEQLA